MAQTSQTEERIEPLNAVPGKDIGRTSQAAAASTAVALDGAGAVTAPDYSSMSHHDLTRIGARWDDLGDAERQALLQEVKLRMARQQGSDGVLQIRTQRRYGRIFRRSDGRVLRIETKVIRVRPVQSGPSFGAGFERRSADRQEPDAIEDQEGIADEGADVPVMRVKDKIR